jgi:phage terminase small subunit
MTKLTDRQRAFAREYVIDLAPQAAAIRAGYVEKSAKYTARALLATPAVRALIDETLNARAERAAIDAERVIDELTALSLWDPADFARVQGPADIAALPETVRRAIVGWDWDKAGNFRLKLADKTRALELIGRHLKMWGSTAEDGAMAALADAMERARRRAIDDGRARARHKAH